MSTLSRFIKPALLFSVLGYAQAMASVPVVSLTDSDDNASVSQTNPVNSQLSTSERLAIIERQVANVNQQNYPGKISDLQNQVQQLQGKIDELSHQSQALADQMKLQYQDINDRLNAAPKPTPAATAPEAPSETAPAKAKPKTKAAPVDANAALSPDATAPVDSEAETAAYQKGFDLLKKGDYVRAAPAFENFLKAYPKGPHAPNAHFWLGEIHLAQNQADAAAAEYRRVLTDFPKSDKVQMAELKLGFAYHDQGDLCKAKSTFERVMKNYPKTTAANLAKKAFADIPSPCSSSARATKAKS